MMSFTKRTKAVILNLDIGDKLTAISCGHIVVELIKFIVYQRLQIPYTYQWLKQVVNKKKMCDNKDVKESFQSERHFRSASSALENLDFILKSLLLEISGSFIPDEVCIVLGSTQVTCKEVYRILLPITCHKPQCQSSAIATDQKIQNEVFRSLVTSEKLCQVFSNIMTPMNMYVFIKKRLTNTQDVKISTDSFELTAGFRIPSKTRVVVIDFRMENNDNTSCCNDFKIFGDTPTNDYNRLDSDCHEEFCEIQSTDVAKWYQSTYVMRGFKDCVVNGNSVINDWLHS
ncbi:hypothetical protein K1T71_010804 [Dendrolimus kikuchii]|uniref:Uncharacterized protein n=1 Tax=Dendrolimus kikuchii TaxID=765133 RepID=A0ACC1CQ04_9NEOP|nr:hypothetical protein K1T71_010804 [Dendrolimus kikuchii]